MKEETVKLLPPDVDLETKKVLRQLTRSHRALAELKGYADTMPNKNVLINAVTVNEAKDSSEIENIITTHDELFKVMSSPNYNNPAAKEVMNYRTALWNGYTMVKEKQLLTTNMIIEIQQFIEENLYTPPSGEQEIRSLLANLEKYINDDYDQVDLLVKLAVVHFQFESIHPFYDGNGRSGRIINVLYLILKELLDSPILYLSKYIIRNKTAYYRLLQEVRTLGNWEEWILYILDGVEQTAEETLILVKRINRIIEQTADDIRLVLPKIYSKDLVNLLFFEFYTKISYIEEGLHVSRKTASGYLMSLEEAGFLTSHKIGKEKIYMNQRLFDVVQEAGLIK